MPLKQAGDAAGFITLDEEKNETRLSLAVRVTDEATGRLLKVPVRIRLKERNILPTKNNSGYYLFFDLAPATYTVTVDADSYEYREELITIPMPDENNPVHEILTKIQIKT